LQVEQHHLVDDVADEQHFHVRVSDGLVEGVLFGHFSTAHAPLCAYGVHLLDNVCVVDVRLTCLHSIHIFLQTRLCTWAAIGRVEQQQFYNIILNKVGHACAAHCVHWRSCRVV